MWGTAYTHEGYIARVHPSRLKDRLDELLDENDSIWDQTRHYALKVPSHRKVC